MYLIFNITSDSKYKKRRLYYSPYLIYSFLKKKFNNSLLLSTLNCELMDNKIYFAFLDETVSQAASVYLEDRISKNINIKRLYVTAKIVNTEGEYEYKTLDDLYFILHKDINNVIPINDPILKESIRECEKNRFLPFLASNVKGEVIENEICIR